LFHRCITVNSDIGGDSEHLKKFTREFSGNGIILDEQHAGRNSPTRNIGLSSYPEACTRYRRRVGIGGAGHDLLFHLHLLLALL
jgi:hypothetical protein